MATMAQGGGQDAGVDQRSGVITASVDVITSPPDGLVKVRAIIWSGPDFKTPTITRGALFDAESEAREVASRYVESLERVGIPVDGNAVGDAAAEPVLPEKRPESEYERR